MGAVRKKVNCPIFKMLKLVRALNAARLFIFIKLTFHFMYKKNLLLNTKVFILHETIWNIKGPLN